MVQGRGIDAPLNAHGQQQAQKVYEHLVHETFDAIYTSSLIRTHQTVKGFTDAGHAITPMAGFDEISWGSMEGIKATYEEKNLYAQTIKEWQSGDLHQVVGGGESPLEVMARQKVAMKQVMEAPHATILICMHGRAMRILLSWLLAYPLEEMDQFTHTNCGYYRLGYTDGKFEMQVFNHTDHLL